MEEDSARLEELGLVEVPVAGSPYKLLRLKEPGKAPPTLAQRVEMARRLNEVGPKLPRYVKLINSARPAASTEAVINAANSDQIGGREMSKKQEAAQGEIDPKEVEKAFKENLKDEEQRQKAKAEAEKKKAAEKEKKEKAKKAARKAAKGKDVTPKAAPTSAAKEQTEKAAKKQTAAKENGGKRGGIGTLVCDLLLAKKETADILSEVKKKFPQARTSPASIAWYRSRLREDGKLPK